MEERARTFTVRIQHHVHDFAEWKAAFDSDPGRRQESGVRRYRIQRQVDDPLLVMIDLDVDSQSAADTFLATMRRVWQGPRATGALLDGPQVSIVKVVGAFEYRRVG